ncbi:hypothetical protein IQ263_01185 [Tychonema sp. LEGE 06208]|nr:hypothetical protein [Tychonema sp. LEGE 06208]
MKFGFRRHVRDVKDVTDTEVRGSREEGKFFHTPLLPHSRSPLLPFSD